MSDDINIVDKYIIKTDRLYTTTHEWMKKEGDVWLYGITGYASVEMGELAFVEFPEVGDKFPKGEPTLTIEALKTVEDSYAPFDCEVVEVNEPLEDDANIIHEDPYEEGWLLKLVPTGSEEGLISPEEYAEIVKKEIEVH